MNRQPRKLIKLALQGGGSHGAFTWGVLDHLLEDERLSHRGHQRHQRRRDERRCPRRRHGARRPGRGAQMPRKILVGDQRRGPVQPDPPVDRRYLYGQLEPRHVAGLYFDGPSVAPVFALRPQSDEFQSACAMSSPNASISTRSTTRAASKYFCRDQCPQRPAKDFSATRRSSSTASWPRLACRLCSRRSKSTARPIGTAAIWAIRPCSRWSTNARPAMSW